MPVEALDLFCYYDVQRFKMFGPMDCANWYRIAVEKSKRQQALYPAMGRKHINSFSENKLVFELEPQQMFKTINYMYVIAGTQVFQIDKNFDKRLIGSIPLGRTVWFAYLPVGDIVYAILTAETIMYVITENADGTVSYVPVTDTNAPTKPLYVAAFGNRFVVSQSGTPNYYLSRINLDGNAFNPANAFSFGSPPAPLFNRATGVVRQFAVLNNQLYIFSDYQTDIWANVQSQITVNGVTRTFPWKINTSYNFNVGLNDPLSLKVDFDMMVFQAQNSSGLINFVASTGQKPQNIDSQAINVLLENSTQTDIVSPFLKGKTVGILYQYENTVFYRASAGPYTGEGELDDTEIANAIEYNFSTQTWHRVIELNGERNRIEKHVYFNNLNIVSVQGDSALYEMAGNIYHNETRTPGTQSQDANAFTKHPMRYTLVSPQIFQTDYSEFITDYLEIDFVFGDKTFYKNNAPFANAVFLVTEDAAPDGSPHYIVAEDQIGGEDVYILAEEGNTPGFDDNYYNQLFKPHIELYFSDDGGVTFNSADLREFSQLGVYRWRMRWYELGASRNRCYKLVCVSSAPIVLLGACHNLRRASGGAN
ncbi:MAG: hypothetical protein KBB94_10320 [Legionellaceae bacterium]|nr:hypothetical protein [Legionellaceae bacterium]